RRFGPLDNSDNSPALASPFLLLKTRPGVTAADLRHTVLHDDPTSGIVLAAQRPNDVMSYQHLQLTPMLLAALLVLLAIATTAHRGQRWRDGARHCRGPRAARRDFEDGVMATSRIAIDGVPARRSANGVVVLGATALAAAAIVLAVVGIGDHNDPLGRSLVAIV